MPLTRHPSLVPLSHDHHTGLARAFALRRALKVGFDLEIEVARCRRFVTESLAPHFRAEEEVLVPLLRELLDPDDDAAERLVAEHRELERRGSSLAAGFPESIALFAELLERHIRFEERELFEKIQQRITDAARLARFEDDLRRVLGRPTDAPGCSLPEVDTKVVEG